ncbi:MAG: hypothetical protein ABW096_18145 [Candidatus Thiodiazotropha sp.]
MNDQLNDQKLLLGLITLILIGYCYLSVINRVYASEKVSINELPMKPPIKKNDPNYQWFKARFGLTWEELETSYSVEEIDQFLLRWRNSYPNDPEAWISSANWNWRQAEQPMFYSSTNESGAYITEEGNDDEQSLALNQLNGGGSEFIQIGKFTIEERREEALAIYNDAIQKFPYRTDIYDNIIKFHEYYTSYSKIPDVLHTMSLSLPHDHSLETTNYQTEQQSRNDILVNMFHTAAMRLYSVESQAAADALLDVTLLMTRTLPKSQIAWNDLVAAYDLLGNAQGAYGAARKAYELSPNDEIVVVNLAKYSIELGYRNEAIKLNKWLLENAQFPELKERAKADLRLLGVAE